ncbi:MAG: ribonucleoside-diphosphate reductase subunit alpha [Candidatus Magasanikbacteria bacterium]
MINISHIRKRSGEVVAFEADKIEEAIRSAHLDARGSVNQVDIKDITEKAIQHLEETFSSSKEEEVPSVEDVQNTVEATLMEEGLYDVAKAYIIYRYEHEKERQEKKEKAAKKVKEEGLKITKRSGETELFSEDKLRRSIEKFAEGLDNIDVDRLVEQCRSELYEEISTEDIQHALVLTARGFIEEEPEYSDFAARVLFDSLYKSIIGEDRIDYDNLEKQHQVAFIAHIKNGVEIGELDPKLLTFDLEEMSKKMDLSRDHKFDYLAAQTLYDRYFLRNSETDEILETPQMFWMRVAMGLALDEDDKEEKAKRFYDLLSNKDFIHSTPTLFHSGTTHPQLSSCYINTVDDDLEHIYKVIKDNAVMGKYSGGIGTDWTNIRANGAYISSTGIESQGLVPFLKIQNDSILAINRSGDRRAAGCSYLETWHLDIKDFLELRRNTGDERRRTHDMNIANWIPDLFMQRVRDDEEWTLFSPDEVPDLHHTYGKDFKRRYEEYEEKAENGELRQYKKIKARNLWRKMVSMLYETGHPWMCWKDPCNIRSPQDHVGTIHSSNLCTEITLNTSFEETAVCNLGSVNLKNHMRDGELDQEKIKSTVTTAMRMLDNVIDLNFYPTEEAETSNMRHRPIGLGIMGFQDALFKADINFEDDEAIEFADKSMEMISYYAIRGSALLAKERGPYKTYRGSKWDRDILPIDTIDILEDERGEEVPLSRETRMDWDKVRELIDKHGMRNSNTMAVAPTATISNIAGVFPTIEPIYKNIYVKSNMSGEFTRVNRYLIDDLKERDLWSPELLKKIKQKDGKISRVDEIPQEIKDKYKESFELDPKHLIEVAAERGKWIDQSQSLNIFYEGSSGKEISEIYMHAWKYGLKTTYYLRTLGANTVEKSTVSLESKGKRDEDSTEETTDAVSTGTVNIESEREKVSTKSKKTENTAKQKEATPSSDSESGSTSRRARTGLETSSDRSKTENEQNKNVDDSDSDSNLETIGRPDCEACQ